MEPSLVRSKCMIVGIGPGNSWTAVEDGAVLQEKGVVKAVGTFAELSGQYPSATVYGTGKEILIPGFVNAHHHVGLTPLQLGSPDMPLELWGTTRMIARAVDPYLDTLYSAFEMIESGVTTVQHINGFGSGNAEQTAERFEKAIRAYRDIGMRVSFCFNIRDQSHFVYGDDEAFVQRLPADIQPYMRSFIAARVIPLDGYLDIFRTLFEKYRGVPRVAIQLAPANLHWLSDQALGKVSDLAATTGVPMHLHLVETPYQREYAKRRTGGTAFEHIERFGLAGPKLTLGHGTWLSRSDVERIAETGTCVCVNCSSNMRLRSGRAPLNFMEKTGVNTAIGIDEAGINEDRDMLQEIRLVLKSFRVPGHEPEDVPSVAQVFRMATSGSARTTPFGDTIGALRVGAAADLSLVDWNQIAYPYLDETVPVLDALVQRAKVSGVKLVMCDGEVIFENGRFTRIDRDSILREIHTVMNRAANKEELERRAVATRIKPYVKQYYADKFALSDSIE